MSEEPEIENASTTEPAEEDKAISLAEFLESVPPSQTRKITDLATVRQRSHHPTRPTDITTYYEVLTPEILIHCAHSVCNGSRLFRCTESSLPQFVNFNDRVFLLPYRCGNCNSTTKTFALIGNVTEEQGFGPCPGKCFKFGEFPIYGPPTPSRLISLIGPDREMFLKGRRCENQGLGIGAFV
jgi:hypothetical protein